MHADLCLEFNDRMTPELLAELVDEFGKKLKDKGALVKFDIEVTPLNKAAKFLDCVVALQGAQVIPSAVGGQLIWDPKAPKDKVE